MKKYYVFIILIITTLACGTSAPKVENEVNVEETGTSLPLQNEATAIPTNIPVNNYAVFSINVQDFSYPAESAAVLDKIITLHETYNLPVDIYLTDVMAKIYEEQYPQLLERLKTSPVVAISYHDRAPRPYVNNYDWLGLQNMSFDEMMNTIRNYETHTVDPVTGQITDEVGGYQYVADVIGYAPYAGSSIASDATIDDAVIQVFRELGAQMTVVHGRALNLGDTKKGLYVRPEHYDYMLFQNVGTDPAQGFENALTQAQTSQGVAPYFVGIKMHDNDFFSTQSAWLTVYVDGGKRPNWNPDLKSPLLSQAEQDAMWAMYEQTVIYVASQQDRVGTVNLPMILEMLP